VADYKLKEAENKRRVEEGLSAGLTKEVWIIHFIVYLVLSKKKCLYCSSPTIHHQQHINNNDPPHHATTIIQKQDEEEFNAKREQYEDMRAKIRARASQEGFEKSVATKQAIEDATRRAMAGQKAATPDTMLDLSGFGEKFEDGTDELTPEEQAEIDKIANMPLLDQLKEELANTRFPTPIAVIQTAALMALIFAVSATLILKGDSVIREIYTNWGFIPRPDEVYDFSDLQLPDGFLEQASLEENVLDVANEIVDDMLPGK
jgi:hypothetical protein